MAVGLVSDVEEGAASYIAVSAKMGLLAASTLLVAVFATTVVADVGAPRPSVLASPSMTEAWLTVLTAMVSWPSYPAVGVNAVSGLVIA